MSSTFEKNHCQKQSNDSSNEHEHEYERMMCQNAFYIEVNGMQELVNAYGQRHRAGIPKKNKNRNTFPEKVERVKFRSDTIEQMLAWAGQLNR